MFHFLAMAFQVIDRSSLEPLVIKDNLLYLLMIMSLIKWYGACFGEGESGESFGFHARGPTRAGNQSPSSAFMPEEGSKMKDRPGTAAFIKKMEQLKQLQDAGRLREALALALETLQEEVHRLQESFQALKEKMAQVPRPTPEPRDHRLPPPRKKRPLH
jgi:hypothetical protein